MMLSAIPHSQQLPEGLCNSPEENASKLQVTPPVDDWSLCLLFLLTDGKAHY